MTARGYFNKYVDRVKEDTLNGSKDVVNDIYKDFDEEFILRFSITHKSDPDKLAKSIFEELNKKWNTLRAIFMKELKFTIMDKDEFLTRFEEEHSGYFDAGCEAQ